MPDEKNQNGDQPTYVTAEDLDAKLNAAISGHLKRLKIPSADDITKAIDASFEKRQKDAPPPPPPPGGTGVEGGKAPSPELAAMQARLDEMSKEMQKRDKLIEGERAARVAAEQKSREERARNAMRTHLASGGVREDMVDDLVDLHFGRGRVSFDDDGNPLFKVKRPAGGGLPEEETALPLTDGVDFWLKSKDSARYMPAPGTQGGANAGAKGTPRGGRPATAMPRYDKPATTDDEKLHRAMERERALAARNQ